MKILRKGDTEIGAFRVRGHKKPILGIMIGGSLIGYGSFQNAKAADAFMDALAQLIGAEKEEDEEV